IVRGFVGSHVFFVYIGSQNSIVQFFQKTFLFLPRFLLTNYKRIQLNVFFKLCDKLFWRKIYKQCILKNESLDALLEEQSLYWNDDKEIVDTFVLKTIKRFDEKQGAKQVLLPEFRDEEDKEFAGRLFRRAIQNEDYYRHLISENTKNWDIERVAFMDVIIMQCALAEILSFPNIPISVSLNEYVEIAKLYSTSKSGSFINGTLDGIIKRMKKEGKLNKN
ncbi:hypothetical protein EZS27_037772, partial [termite gut metagenome]